MRILFSFLLSFVVTLGVAQTHYLSGNFIIDTLPTAVSGSKFIVRGDFKDPRGLFFPSDIEVGMTFWRHGAHFTIDSLISTSTNPVTIRVKDDTSLGYIAIGVASVMARTPRGILLPPATGDNHPEYTLPPDYSAIMAEVVKKIDSLVTPSQATYAVFKLNTSTPDTTGQSQPVYGMEQLLNTDTSAIEMQGDSTYFNLAEGKYRISYHGTASGIEVDADRLAHGYFVEPGDGEDDDDNYENAIFTPNTTDAPYGVQFSNTAIVDITAPTGLSYLIVGSGNALQHQEILSLKVVIEKIE